MHAGKRKPPTMIYRAIVVGLFLTILGVVMGISDPGLSDTDLNVVQTQVHLPVVIATAIFYGFILFRLVAIGGRLVTYKATILAFVPLVLYCTLSSFWSMDPGLTARRSGFLFLSTIVGMILGADFDVAEIAHMIAIASLLHMVLCLGLVIISPSLLYSPSDIHSMKGLTTHKNIFGFEQGIAVLVFLLVPFKHLTALRLPLTAAAFMLLILSRSSGSLVATVSALAVLPVLVLLSRPGPHRLPLTLVISGLLGAAGVALSQNIDIIPRLLSKDPTLTGRTELWSLVMVAISHHAILGYGFDSFWQGLQGESLEIIRGVGWLVPTAHNGYLDLLLSGGIGGAVLFVPCLVLMFSRSLRFLSQERSSVRYFPLMFMVLWLVYNLNESALLTRSGLPFLFITAIATSMGVRSRRKASAKSVNWRRVTSPEPEYVDVPLGA